MADPFVQYNAALEAFMQGGKADLATLYSETAKLRETSFIPTESTSLTQFYRSVADKYKEKTEEARKNKLSLEEDINSAYEKAESIYLEAAKKQAIEDLRLGGKLSSPARQPKQALAESIGNTTSISELKTLVPTFSLKDYSGFGRDSGWEKYITPTGERLSAAKVYEKTYLKKWGDYAGFEMDFDTYSKQAETSETSFAAEMKRLATENERRRREFMDTKNKLLTSAEAIGRSKRPAYTERPL